MSELYRAYQYAEPKHYGIETAQDIVRQRMVSVKDATTLERIQRDIQLALSSCKLLSNLSNIKYNDALIKMNDELKQRKHEDIAVVRDKVFRLLNAFVPNE